MAFDDDLTGRTQTNSLSILFLAPGRSEAKTVDTALSRHDLSVTVEYDVARALENLPTADHECIVVPDTLSSITCDQVLDEIRDRDRFVPVVFLLSQANDDLLERLDSSETTDALEGDVESVSYDRLADRIRANVATYRTSQARRSERDIVERLQDRIRRTERKITALHNVAMDLSATSTADEVYQQTVRAAETILDLDICFAFAAREDSFVPKAQSSTPTDRDLSPVPIDAGVMGETYRTGESDRTVDMDLHALADPEFGEYRSGISVPIGEYGVFQAVSEDSGAFDEIDLELTELLTAHTASALQRLSFEKQLRIERDRYAALFRNSTDCILEAEFVDDNAIVRRVNPAFEAVFGYAERDIVGRNVDDVIAAEDRREEARQLTKQVHEGEVVQAEVRRQTSDGLSDFLLRSVPVDDDTLYAVYTDITDQKETERTIERQRERLDAFAGTVSHDLRNPLEVANAGVELAREKRDVDHLKNVEEAHDRIAALIDNLLTLAREGGEALTVEPVELATVVGSSWDAVATEDASLVVEAESTVYADEGQLQELFENLIRNAIEHGGENVSVTVGELEDGFFVEDDGPGIPPDERDDVFEPGYTLSKDGTGFGLSIVEQVAEFHEWDVRVTEGSDGGARFEIVNIEFE